MTILVTGCSGFIGEALCRRLIREGKEVLGIDIREPPRDLDIEFIRMDISDSCIQHLNFKIDTIFHLAALVPIARRSAYEYIRVNMIGTGYLLSLRPRKFIFISSSAVYGCPNGIITENTNFKPIEIYGKSKILAEQECNLFKGSDMNNYSKT